MKHANLPIFSPHMGCPNACDFCDQRSISGKMEFREQSVREEIETALATIDRETKTEIAFFGGSFTGIDRGLMCRLLALAKNYVDEGRVTGIRLSTRPDYIDEEVLDILLQYGVTHIELGLQSMDDDVLKRAKRGHDSACAEQACRLVKQYGFSLVGQMMIGLPDSSAEKEKATAKRLCELSVDAVRIYPTVVFRGTELCAMAEAGSYEMLDEAQAIERTKIALRVFVERGIPCIRVGLCASEKLSGSEVFGGASHSAIGELAMGELYYDLICERLDEMGDLSGKSMVIYVAKGAVSKAIGQKRKNYRRIFEKYSLKRLKILEKNEILSYNIMIDYII
ncbi:MAG: radical SAM protein [Clostridia bacterium]|nr:radical SAM protein [Clostridia bacterium]